MNHQLNVNVATLFNVNISLFLNNLAFWTQYNIANRTNFHDGRYWVYNSIRAFLELFPYWTEDQIRTVISNCIKSDLLVEGNYNSTKYDRTKWYSLTDKALELYNLKSIPPDKLEENNTGKNPKSSPEPFGKNPKSIREKSQINSGEIPNLFGENPRPIPNSKTDNKTTTTTSAQILNKNRGTEPVVVLTNVKIENPKHEVKGSIPVREHTEPLKPVVNQPNESLTIELQNIYRAKPFHTNDILCEDDFIDAGLYALDNLGVKRDGSLVTIRERLHGIKKLVLDGKYEGDPEWLKQRASQKKRLEGDKSLASIEKLFDDKAKDELKLPDNIKPVKSLSELLGRIADDPNYKINKEKLKIEKKEANKEINRRTKKIYLPEQIIQQLI